MASWSLNPISTRHFHPSQSPFTHPLCPAGDLKVKHRFVKEGRGDFGLNSFPMGTCLMSKPLDSTALATTQPRLVWQVGVASLSRLCLNTARRFAYPFAPALSRGLGVAGRNLWIECGGCGSRHNGYWCCGAGRRRFNRCAFRQNRLAARRLHRFDAIHLELHRPAMVWMHASFGFDSAFFVFLTLEFSMIK